MRTIPKILISLTIFLVTLGILLYIKNLLALNSGHGHEKKISIIKEGNPGRYPELADLFQYPGTVVKISLSDYEGPISETTYEINEYGLRSRISSEKKKEHLLVGGCSFVFGYGLNYKWTLTEILQKKLPVVNVQNLGFPHGGVHTSLRYFELVNPKLFTTEEEGTFVYVMIYDHLRRFLRTQVYLSRPVAKAPFYNVVNGKVIYGGKVGETSGFWAMSFLKVFGLNNFFYSTNQITDEALESFVSGVSELKMRYLSFFPRGRFVWVIHPTPGGSPRLYDRMKKIADKNGIEILYSVPDFQKFLRDGGGNMQEHFQKKSPHPSKISNEFFSDWLKNRLYGNR